MAVKYIQYTWDRSASNTICWGPSKERSPLFPINEEHQWYLELAQNGNPLSVQLRQNNPLEIYIVQNLNISIGPDVVGQCSPYGSNNTNHKIKYKNITVSFQVKEEFNYSMLRDKEFCDFTIVVQNTEIAVHKIILATRSPVFYAMLTNNLLEKKTNSINIIDFDKNTIFALICFIYTGNIYLTGRHKNEFKNLMIAADKYDVKDLQLKCENFFLENLDVSNAIDVLIFTEQYNFFRLQKEILDNMAKNLRSFSDESLKALDSYPHLYRALISKIERK